MAVTDIATRTYNHGFRLDPIVRRLLDTDFYTLLMRTAATRGGTSGRVKADGSV